MGTFFNKQELQEELISDEIKITLYKIFQEVVTNLIRHSKCSNFTVKISLNNRNVILEMADDGLGFNKKEAEQKKHLGLIHIRERAMMLGGICVLESAPGKGTFILIQVPLSVQ
jgi:signal transduction histidine kinase